MKIAISAAETSGDLIAARLVKSLKSQNPELIVQGLAGEKMTSSGCEQLWDQKLVNVMGFSEVLIKLSSILRLRRDIINYFSYNKPRVFIGVDAPDFNFNIEKKLKNRGVKTVHFISPSIWAWRESRIKKIQKSTDLVICVFPFEIDFYNRHNQRAVFVGHPLAQVLSPRVQHAPSKVILLMPGSRESEIKSLLPEMISAVKIMSNKDKELKFKLVLASEDMSEPVKKQIKDLNIDVSVGDAHKWIIKSDLAIVASGTATLELALVGVPMVVVYKLSALSYFVMSRLLKSPFVSLPNVIANKFLVPELIQNDANGKNISKHAFNILSSDNKSLVEEFSNIHSQLKSNSIDDAARAIIDLAND
jgi:lipid-A-disaccharide synthase